MSGGSGPGRGATRRAHRWLRYHAERAEVELVADRVDGPCAGVHRMGALEFLARWAAHGSQSTW